MLARDGYVRITFAEFCALSMRRHMVWQDVDLRTELCEQGIEAVAAGYCEWVSLHYRPQVSLGWAWFKSAPGSSVMLAPGGISANIMLCTDNGQDLGTQHTADLLLGWLSSQSWQQDILTLH